MATINPFGNENLDYILDDHTYMANLMKNRPYDNVMMLFEYIWLDNRHPENQNIRYKREFPTKEFVVFLHGAWLIKDGDECIKHIIQTCVKIAQKANENSYYAIQDPTLDDMSYYHKLSDQYKDIISKKRGTYLSLASSIVSRLKECKAHVERWHRL